MQSYHPFVRRLLVDNPKRRGRQISFLNSPEELQAFSDKIPWKEDNDGKVIYVDWDSLRKLCSPRQIDICVWFRVAQCVPLQFLAFSTEWYLRTSMLGFSDSWIRRQLRQFYVHGVKHLLFPLFEEHFRTHSLQILSSILLIRFEFEPGYRTGVWRMRFYDTNNECFVAYVSDQADIDIDMLSSVQCCSGKRSFKMVYLIIALGNSLNAVRHLMLALLPGAVLHKVFYEHPLGDLQIVRLISAFL